MSIVDFFPLNPEHKMPVGALQAGGVLKLVLRFTRPANPERVYLVITKDGEDCVRYKANFISLDADTYRFEIEQSITSCGLYFYHFEIETDNETVRIGSGGDMRALYGKGNDWQLTVYNSINAPKWLEGGLIYQIMPDRFCIGGERAKSKSGMVYRDDWGGCPEFEPKDGRILNNDFFGGNLNGITKKLGYLKNLGVTCIYLNPIFEAYSNHKYDTGNYMKIDPDFGTEDDLKRLIRRANTKGIRIILDGVFSHTGDDSIYFNKYCRYDSIGAFQSERSPYRSWYNWYKQEGSKDEKYECWWNIDTLPNTNENDPSFSEFICGEEGVARRWTRLGIGGWRLDVVDELPDEFLERFKRAVKKVNQETFILGEVWEDASNKVSWGKRRSYFTRGQLDSVMNYPFMSDIINFALSGNDARLRNTLNYIINNYPKHNLDSLMNMLGTHDTVRVLTALDNAERPHDRVSRAKAEIQNPKTAELRLRMATVLQYTLPGVPCVYYGDEVGLSGYEDPFNRRCFPWNNKNNALLRWYKRLGAIRTQCADILSDGSFEHIELERGVMAFRRFNQNGELVVIVNNSGRSINCGFLGRLDLLSNAEFNGVIADKKAVILR